MALRTAALDGRRVVAHGGLDMRWRKAGAGHGSRSTFHRRCAVQTAGTVLYSKYTVKTDATLAQGGTRLRQMSCEMLAVA